MKKLTSRLSLVAFVVGALAAQGCRHAKTTAATPAVVPPSTNTSAPMAETKVTSPAEEFKTPPTPVQAGRTGTNGAIRDAYFPFDSAVMTPESQDNLGSTAQWLRNHQAAKVQIEGHCDERGTEQYNLALGDKRAYDAKTYLATLGIDSKRMTTISYGKEKPFDTGHDEEAWAKNRRAHVVLTSSSQ
jgi:peptidoglycan-associated lipoprotein